MCQTGNNCLPFRRLLVQVLAPRVTLSPHGAAPGKMQTGHYLTVQENHRFLSPREERAPAASVVEGPQ